VIVHAQAPLLEIIFALRTAGSFSGRLHGGQKQPDERGDDRDHHQEFDQREGKTTRTDRRPAMSRWNARHGVVHGPSKRFTKR
jgi:hypothetical protein